MTPTRLSAFLVLAVGLALAMSSAGCGNGGGSADDRDAPPQTYAGLKGQQAAVMVWADQFTRTEFGQIQLDAARLLTMKLTARGKPGAEPAKKEKDAAAGPELAGLRFVDPGSVVRFQRENPETFAMPIEQVAPRLGVPRVIFVEFEQFQIQPPNTYMLLKGYAKVNLRVLEVSGTTAKVVLEELGIEARFPHNAPEGVVPSDRMTPRTVYEGTLNALTDKLSARFVGVTKS